MMLDILWAALGVVLLLLGVAGSFLPVLPGPPLAYAALLLQQARSHPPFDRNFLLIWLAVVVLVTVLDYAVPVYGAKKLGASRQGMWGATIGLVVGLFVGPWGIVLGPLLGAFAGEYSAHQQADRALKAAVGSFLGLVVGFLLKFIVCCIMGWHLVASFF